jgi:organic hydroperoxide reductase OsmC/OhrA
LQGQGHTADIDRPLSIAQRAEDGVGLIGHQGVKLPDLWDYSRGGGGPQVNPEQLFALGYAACVHSAALCTARQRRAEVGTRSQEACPPPNRVPRRAVGLP